MASRALPLTKSELVQTLNMLTGDDNNPSDWTVANLLEVIRSLPDEDRRWLLEQLGGETVDRSSQDLAELTQAGQAFDDLAQEPDLYSFSDGEPVVAA